MKFIAIKNHKISFSQTHNLEVLGSSPSWSTFKIKHLRGSRKCFFHVCVNKLNNKFACNLLIRTAKIDELAFTGNLFYTLCV